MFTDKQKLEATIEKYGLTESKAGNVSPFITFNTAEGMITWFGNLSSDKATEFCIKNLVTAGFQGDDFSDLSKPLMFDGRKLQIEIEMYEGKAKVKYINKVSTGPKSFSGQAPKMAATFAKIRTTLTEKKKEVDAF